MKLLRINKTNIGKQAEDTALAFLFTHRCQLIVRNYHSRYGEIDLIMLDQGILIFVEVRARSESAYVSAVESVDWAKQQKIAKTASVFLSSKEGMQYQDFFCRFDVIAISLTSQKIEWLKDSFTLS